MILASKHFLIGFGDICFWWSVWLLSDNLFPFRSLVSDGYTLLRGYTLIVTSNIAYFTIRWFYFETFVKNYDHFSSISFPAVILNHSQSVKNKPIKFRLLKALLPLFVYGLVVGFIQMWRALFHIFGFLLQLFEDKYSVNQALLAVVFQLIVAISLAFTRRNNAVNLCPTHETYKHDELQYLDELFNINNLSFMKVIKKEVKHYGTGNKRFHLPNFFKREKTIAQSESIIDAEFDIVKFLTDKLIGSISSSDKKPISGLWQIIVDSAEPAKKTEDDDKTAVHLEEQNKIVHPLSGIFLHPLQLSPTSSPVSSPVLSEPKVIRVNEFNRENTIAWESKRSTVSINITSDEVKQQKNIKDIGSMTDCLFTMDQLNEVQRGYAKALRDISNKRFHQRNASISISVENNNLVRPKIPIQASKRKDKKNNSSEDWRHLAIKSMGYVYAIHHRHIFLHIFGGMFWSSTWKIFDFMTEKMFTKTPSDIPALFLVAVLCHSLNQLVLFRFKEITSSIYWKTFYELLCGLFTVFLWASLWYVLDAVSMSTGKMVPKLLMDVMFT